MICSCLCGCLVLFISSVCGLSQQGGVALISIDDPIHRLVLRYVLRQEFPLTRLCIEYLRSEAPNNFLVWLFTFSFLNLVSYLFRRWVR